MMIDVTICWYIVLMLLITGYAILDGFDLGVGILHLFARTDKQRRIHLNAIGPVWDGNEVWLVTAGGAFFAGFPAAYATLASAFYIPMLMLLMGLIFRACAIEFRSKHPSTLWRNCWDSSFSLASIIIAISLGMILGHLIQGIPLDQDYEIIREEFNFFQPFPFLTGLLAISLFAMHGSLYLLMKTEEPEHEKIRRLVMPCIGLFMGLYILTTFCTLIYMPHMTKPFYQYPWLIFIPVVGILAVCNIPRQIQRRCDFRAFFSSSLSIVSLLAIYALGQFPYLIRSSLASNYSLHIYNASSSHKSLSILLLFVAIGIPFVLSYTFAVYWIFRGKVRLDSTSY
jgi:cytochrome d ubiquinol oxidase subunit II